MKKQKVTLVDGGLIGRTKTSVKGSDDVVFDYPRIRFDQDLTPECQARIVEFCRQHGADKLFESIQDKVESGLRYAFSGFFSKAERVRVTEPTSQNAARTKLNEHAVQLIGGGDGAKGADLIARMQVPGVDYKALWWEFIGNDLISDDESDN